LFALSNFHWRFNVVFHDFSSHHFHSFSIVAAYTKMVNYVRHGSKKQLLSRTQKRLWKGNTRYLSHKLKVRYWSSWSASEMPEWSMYWCSDIMVIAVQQITWHVNYYCSPEHPHNAVTCIIILKHSGRFTNLAFFYIHLSVCHYHKTRITFPQ
jgi:hypothetical protein